MKLLSFFGNPEHLFEEYMFQFQESKQEQEQEQEEHQQSKKKRKLSMDSSNSSLMRNSSSQLSSLGSRYSTQNKVLVHPDKKFMKESKSDFSLLSHNPTPLRK